MNETVLMVDGIKVKEYLLRDGTGLEVVVTNLGAAVREIYIKDKAEKTDVVLGFSKIEKQLEKGPMFGVTLGRYAGKVINAECNINGQHFMLTKSHGENHAHGGHRGFDKHVFCTELVTENKIVFTYYSVNGEEGYPGNLRLKVVYEVLNRSLCLRYEAKTDRDTPVNISNHMYFNLSGNGGKDITNQEVMICASKIEEIDERGLPNGKVLELSGTAMDFRQKKMINECFENPTEMMRRVGGLDHDYILDANGENADVVLFEKNSGRKMEVFTNMPCIHVYVPDFCGMNYIGKKNQVYNGKCGICFEPMYAGNSINNGIGGIPILRKDEVWIQETRYVFSW